MPKPPGSELQIRPRAPPSLLMARYASGPCPSRERGGAGNCIGDICQERVANKRTPVRADQRIRATDVRGIFVPPTLLAITDEVIEYDGFCWVAFGRLGEKRTFPIRDDSVIDPEQTLGEPIIILGCCAVSTAIPRILGIE
jgi:hypothetical protein